MNEQLGLQISIIIIINQTRYHHAVAGTDPLELKIKGNREHLFCSRVEPLYKLNDKGKCREIGAGLAWLERNGMDWRKLEINS